MLSSIYSLSFSDDFGFYENIGANNWPSFRSIWITPFNIGSIGGNATPFLVDLDNDGDYDLFAGGTGGLRYYENVGNATIASYGPEVQSPFSIISPPRVYSYKIQSSGLIFS